MIIITKDQIGRLNQTICKSYDETSLLVNDEVLSLMVAEVYHKDQYGNFYIYKNPIEQASKMYCFFQENEPFESHNKETGLLYLLTLLDINNIELVYDNNDLKDLILRGNSYKQVLEWIVMHINPTKRLERQLWGLYPGAMKKRKLALKNS